LAVFADFAVIVELPDDNDGTNTAPPSYVMSKGASRKIDRQILTLKTSFHLRTELENNQGWFVLVWKSSGTRRFLL